MAFVGAAMFGSAVLFFLVALVQFTREAMRSSREPKHLVRLMRGRPAATVFTLRQGRMTNSGGWAGKAYFEDTGNILTRERQPAQVHVGVKKNRPR
jgi:hypothetical protein